MSGCLLVRLATTDDLCLGPEIHYKTMMFYLSLHLLTRILLEKKLPLLNYFVTFRYSWFISILQRKLICFFKYHYELTDLNIFDVTDYIAVLPAGAQTVSSLASQHPFN